MPSTDPAAAIRVQIAIQERMVAQSRQPAVAQIHARLAAAYRGQLRRASFPLPMTIR